MIRTDSDGFTSAVQAAGRARFSFYAWRNRAETATAARRRELSVLVMAALEAGRGAYGCRRVAAQLNLGWGVLTGHPVDPDLRKRIRCKPPAWDHVCVIESGESRQAPGAS